MVKCTIKFFIFGLVLYSQNVVSDSRQEIKGNEFKILDSKIIDLEKKMNIEIEHLKEKNKELEMTIIQYGSCPNPPCSLFSDK